MSTDKYVRSVTDGTGLLRETAVSHIGLCVPDPERVARFYETTLGLQLHEIRADGAHRLGWGAGHHVLELQPGARSLGHYGFEVRDSDGINRIRDRLVSSSSEVLGLDDIYIDAAVGAATGVATRDPDGNLVHFHSAVGRHGEAGAIQARPIRYQHITLGTTAVSPMVSFFTEIVGFSVSDRLADGNFTWMRSDHAHHTLAVVNVGESNQIDHYSYDLRGWADFEVWCDRLSEQGVRVQWGPGRHGPGNNLFVFFDDPAGNHIELSAEMETFWDDRVTYTPREWQPSPDTVNLWGGQPALWRSPHEAGA